MKAVLVFCEGRHDVVFAQRSLGAHGGCQWVNRRISELPSPFGTGGAARKAFIAGRIERAALDDLTLTAAAQPGLPCFESAVENAATDTVFFLVCAHGQSQHGVIVNLLRDLDDTLASSEFDVSKYWAAFLFDANEEGVAAKLDVFRKSYGGHFGDLARIEHGTWIETQTVPVGCFVFHRSSRDRTGTLEDHLAPMARAAWPARYAAAQRFLDDHRIDSDRVSIKDAERVKAIITAAGQFDHPGDPMSIIIGRKGLPAVQFDQSPLSAQLAGFLTRRRPSTR